MGYACPVCGDPQADARHLANHLAFTAMLGREDHEAWLDDHAPGWAEEGEHELADRVADLAADAEYPQVFEDTTGRLDSEAAAEGDHDRSGKLFEHEGHAGHDHLQNDPGHASHDHGHGYQQADVPRDPETQEVLEEARELTREMLEPDDDPDDPDDSGTSEATDDPDDSDT
jgi:hypothetical protein